MLVSMQTLHRYLCYVPNHKVTYCFYELFMARPEGFEPPTPWFVVLQSNLANPLI